MHSKAMQHSPVEQDKINYFGPQNLDCKTSMVRNLTSLTWMKKGHSLLYFCSFLEKCHSDPVWDSTGNTLKGNSRSPNMISTSKEQLYHAPFGIFLQNSYWYQFTFGCFSFFSLPLMICTKAARILRKLSSESRVKWIICNHQDMH